MKKLFLLASLLMAFGISADAGDITSPNGQIKVNFTLDGTVPTYSVTYQGKTIIKPSRLGYQLAKGGNCLLYTSPSPRDLSTSRMPSSA